MPISKRTSTRKNDEAVSPVIATILMVAITVVLAATVYFWLTGFGANQPEAVSASFGSQASDVPADGFTIAAAYNDADLAVDSLQVTLVQGQTTFALAEISFTLDGQSFTPAGDGSQAPANGLWTVEDGGLGAEWNAGDVIYIIPAPGACQVDTHNLIISVRGAVVFNSEIEITDDVNDAAGCPP